VTEVTEPNQTGSKPPKERDRLARFLFWIFGPPTAENAISAHSPQARAYREQQRAARRQQREQQRD
jgi:hypothetical protein